MARGDRTVITISAVLVAVVVAAVGFSVFVLDRSPSSAAIESSDSDSSRLVATWGPSLCRTDPSNSGCKSGHVGEMGRTFVLHGLWPQPFSDQYCDVPRDVADRAAKLKGPDMPSVDLSEDVRAGLQSNLSDGSVMAPHEWYAHGTCSGVAPDKYFGDALTLIDEARKVLDPLFSQATKKGLTLSAVRDQFDAQFGQGAGERVALTCRNVTGEGAVAYEVQLSLPPVNAMGIDGKALSLGDLLLEGPPIAPTCRHGRVP
jgi:ribonuclease T2